ncbi:tetratricopeptide repeat protein [Aureispira sp. CCB-QB1]|uniref:tetratricopeptide repeat protein n=1 Tax=Aureispira sp. CCB-QB1 TaxID=1313421 RepID=UPI000695D711|nr:tetratricopeptide repeat protein [Aureispira sp. CCB-QB1]
MHNFTPKQWSLLILLLSITVGVFAQPPQKSRPKESDVLLEKLFIEANREKILGNIDEAIMRYLEVLQKDNDNAAAHYELARLYKQQEVYDKAINRAEKAVALEEYNLLYNNLYASLLEKEGNFKKAAELYANLTDKYSEKEQLYFDWAYFLSKSGKSDQAIKVYNNLEKRVGIKETISMRKYKLYMKSGKQKKASQEIELLIQAYPKEAEYIIRLANFYASTKDLEKAKSLYKKALDIDPNNPTANMAMVEFFLQNGDTSRYLNALVNTFENPHQNLTTKLETLKSLSKQLETGTMSSSYLDQVVLVGKKLLETDPGSPDANLILGDLLYQQQKYNQAVSNYKIAIRFIRNDLNLWKNLLECLLITNQQKELQKRSAQFIELYPSQAASYYYSGIAYYQTGAYQKAIKELGQVPEIAVTDMHLQGKALCYVAKSYEGLENLEKADQAYNEAILMFPNDPEIIHNYAYSLAKRGTMLNKAQELVEGILEKAPKNAKYTTTSGFIAYKQNQYSIAEQTLSKALSFGGNEQPETLERYGDVLFKLGKENEAVNYWQKALDKGSTSSLLQRKISTKQLYE